MSRETALLGIMTADNFKNRTKATNAEGGFVSKFKSRGSAMAGIDIALEAWTAKCDSKAVAVSQKLALVNNIKVECDKWAAQKAQLGKSTVLSVAREQVINEVRKSTLNAHSYLKNKLTAEVKGPTHSTKRGVTKSLEKGYAHERTDYLGRAKQDNPFSGSAVEESAGGLSTMTYGQFTAAAASLDDANRVEYLNRKQRLDFLVTIQNGLFYQDGALLDHLDPKDKDDLWTNTYAVDQYGNIYSKAAKWRGTFFNHSSYCAGKAVLCAGTIGCYQGKLMYVSNMSGHYKPNSIYLRQLLMILAEEGVDLSDTLVEAMDTKRALKAGTLLRAVNAAEDWPHWGTKRGARVPVVMIGGQQAGIINPK
jgi:hypothetical protein